MNIDKIYKLTLKDMNINTKVMNIHEPPQDIVKYILFS